MGYSLKEIAESLEEMKMIDKQDIKEGQIGEADRPIYGFAFGGGAFDTTMYLGVVHALLASERRAPDIVLGVSAGSLAATVLAEVLQAGSQLKPEEAAEARVARFREFLTAYRDAPRELRRAFVPDLFELTNRAPLKPMESPLHCESERHDRREYVKSLSGLSNLINDLLSLRINVHYLIQAGFRWLNLAAVGNYSSPIRQWRCFASNGTKVLSRTFLNLWRIAPLGRQYFASLLPTDTGLRGQSAEQLIGPFRSRMSRVARGITIGLSAGLLYMLFCLGVVFFCLWLPYKLGKSLWEELLLTLTKKRPIPSLKPSTGLRGWIHSVSKDVGRRLLLQYDLQDELSHPYPLKEILIRLIDPENYYGKVKLPHVIEKAIRQVDEVEVREEPKAKTFLHYLQADPPIHVAPVAAELGSLNIDVLPSNSRVVDGLLAANAIPIFFKPVSNGELFGNNAEDGAYIDAAPVTDAPVSLLIDHLKDRVHPNVTSIFLYPVRAFSSKEEKVPLERALDSVLALAERAMDLQRYQHIRLEHRLTKLYHALLPKAVQEIEEKCFISANLHPIEASPSLNLNERIFEAKSVADQDRLVLEAVATGCRRTMEVILEREVAHYAGRGGAVSCAQVVQALLKGEGHPRNDASNSIPSPGPGLPEVCRACRFPEASRSEASQSLEVLGSRDLSPVWPHRDTKTATVESREAISSLSEEFHKADDSLKVPDEPWITLVLSGGVFRGVFQIGVLSALQQASVQPKLFAGASVGSIMAAMAAKLFTVKDGTLELQRLAATFIALDRLVVTDRLADFVRRFMVRANDVRISPKNLDHFLRRLDQPHAGAYSKNARTVLAGIERLFFISPFESWALIQAVHDENTGEAAQLLRRYSAYFFERYGVGMELLGAEPLRLLIAEHVLQDLDSPYNEDPWSTPFDYFLRHEKFLLATSTNATKGELHVFGQEAADNMPCKALLVEALLASSAFPAVFRPRRFAEVYPCDADQSEEAETKFVDGGLMDNLPLDHVITFMHKRARLGQLARRPRGGTVPHLLLTASLEPKAGKMRSPGDSKMFREDWRMVARRVKELSYNRKVEMFTEAQDDFRKIVAAHGQGNSKWPPPDMKVMTVIPKWLCGTFGFHPTLGFRQYKQAASIAHGCAMTFATLSKLQKEPYGNNYGIRAEFAEGAFDDGQVNREFLETLSCTGPKPEPGACWFRRDSRCPFSAEALARSNHESREPRFLEETVRALPMIHEYCRRPETHDQLD
jgi:predicted acylesterase/phospholipase RssA